jgi:hypothetical protein
MKSLLLIILAILFLGCLITPKNESNAGSSLPEKNEDRSAAGIRVGHKPPKELKLSSILIDETSLQAYGAEIIKSSDSGWKARVPIDMIETIADNEKGISFVKLPDRAIPLAVESEGVGLTWEAWPVTDQDYDLYLYDSDLIEVASSITGQTGKQPPTEEFDYPVLANGTYHLKIYKQSATSDHRLAVFSVRHDTDPAVASSSIISPPCCRGRSTDFVPKSNLFRLPAMGRIDLFSRRYG